jgi:HEAT repeat protein
MLKSTNPLDVQKALDSLAQMEPVAPREEATKAIEEALRKTDPITRQAAIKAFAVWADRDTAVAKCIELMNERSPFILKGTIEAARSLRDERTIEPLAKLLAKHVVQREAAAALKLFGEAAEDAVIPYLKDSLVFTRLEAMGVLKEIGTAKCLPELEKLAKSNSSDSLSAKEAINAVKSRISKKK